MEYIYSFAISFLFYLAKFTYILQFMADLGSYQGHLKERLKLLVFLPLVTTLMITIIFDFFPNIDLVSYAIIVYAVIYLIFRLCIPRSDAYLYSCFLLSNVALDSLTLLSGRIADHFDLPFRMTTFILGWVFYFIFHLIFIKFLKVNRGIALIFQNRKIMLTSTVILLVSSLFNEVGFTYMEDQGRMLIITSSGLLLILAAGYAVYLFTKKRLEMQELVIAQQEKYVQSLEMLQKDLRMLQHDYKNVLAGLVHQLESGNVAEAQTYLENIVGNFDANIRERLKQNTQLSHIQQLALKSLMLIKMTEFEQKGILVDLEVLQPVEKINMDSHNLVRCLGILLDNAAEAVADLLERRFQVLITCNDAECTFIVKNVCADRLPNVKQLTKRGFSTKGENRGLGLANYAELTAQYPQIIKATKMENGEFTQILTVMNS